MNRFAPHPPENGGDGREVGRCRKDVGVRGFDLLHQFPHAVLLHALARRLAWNLRALAAVGTEFDRKISQPYDLHGRPVTGECLHGHLHCLVYRAVLAIGTVNGEYSDHCAPRY